MYLEAWHRLFKHKYLDGIQQRRLDFVLFQLLKFDADQQEEELRRKHFVGKRTKRSSLILKNHKLAVDGRNKSVFKISPVDCSDESAFAKFVFNIERTPIIVTLTSDDTTHKCAFTCPECNTCVHRFHCTCSDRHVRRYYCVHLCALGLDKKLLFNFNDQERLTQQKPQQPDLAIDNDDFRNDFGDGASYETDDASEVEHVSQKLILT